MNELRAKCIERWTGARAARQSFPPKWGVWPDTDTPRLLGELCFGTVCEVGCGTGRCASAFDGELYVGVDINPDAIEHAKKKRPGYDFRVIAWDDPYPEADTYLFHTTLQHIPDEDVQDVLDKCCESAAPTVMQDVSELRADGPRARQKVRVVIVEPMQREYRQEDNLIFHREPDWYRVALGLSVFEEIAFLDLSTKYQPNHKNVPLRRRFLVAERRFW